MVLCKKVQVEELYAIHVEDSPDFYTGLRFSLLASPWFPRPLGLALWSVLHMFLVLSVTLMLLAMYSIVFAFAVSIDACVLSLVVALALFFCLCMILDVVIVWIWLVISCNVPRRKPGQALAHFTTGETLPQEPQTPPAAEEQVQTNAVACFLCDVNGYRAPTARLVNHLKVEAIPVWRVTLGNWCREFVPTYDAVVVI